MARRTSKPPHGAFYIAEKYCRPVFADASGRRYPELAESYYIVVEMLSQSYEHRLTLKGSLAINQIVPSWGEFYPRGAHASIRVADQLTIDFLNRLWKKTQAAIEQSYQNGVTKGQSLLTQLASGDITVDEMNKRSIGAEEEE